MGIHKEVESSQWVHKSIYKGIYMLFPNPDLSITSWNLTQGAALMHKYKYCSETKAILRSSHVYNKQTETTMV